MGRASRYSRGLPELAVFAVAIAARSCMVLTSGGFSGNFGYDASVYYSAADALTYGRLPYRDFVLLHPPTIMLLLAPFAWLGRATSDHLGFMVGDSAFMVLGAINAVLVVRVARRMGLPARAATLGGFFYAVWLGSVGAEFLIRLEPTGNFFLLCGLLAYFAARDSPARSLPVLAGAAFGAAASVKIWWVVPLLVLLAWHVQRARRRNLVWTAFGAGVALVVLDGPFFLAAPAQMWRMVVTEQLGRPADNGSPLYRLQSAIGLRSLDPHLGSGAIAAVVTLAIVAVFVAVVGATWRVSGARLVAVLATVQAALLMAAPSWFFFYADYLGPAAALCVAAAVTPQPDATRHRHWTRLIRAAPWTVAALAAAVTVGFLATPDNGSVAPFAGAPLAAAVRSTHCVMSDSPMGLIQLDALSRDFRDGCRDWVDVTGRTYGVDASNRPNGSHVPRRDNVKWQRDLLAYLRSGNAAIIVRRSGSGISPTMITALRRGGVLARSGGKVIYRTPHRTAPQENATASGR